MISQITLNFSNLAQQKRPVANEGSQRRKCDVDSSYEKQVDRGLSET